MFGFFQTGNPGKVYVRIIHVPLLMCSMYIGILDVGKSLAQSRNVPLHTYIWWFVVLCVKYPCTGIMNWLYSVLFALLNFHCMYMTLYIILQLIYAYLFRFLEQLSTMRL